MKRKTKTASRLSFLPLTLTVLVALTTAIEAQGQRQSQTLPPTPTTCGSTVTPASATGPVDLVFSARDKIQLGKRRIRRRVVLKIIDLNPIRYSYSVNGDRVTVAEPVDLSKLPFLPPIPSSGTPATTAPQQPPTPIPPTILGVQGTEITAKRGEIAAKEGVIKDDKKNISDKEKDIRKERDRFKADTERFELIDLQKTLDEHQKELDQLKKELADLQKKQALGGVETAFEEIQARYITAETQVSGSTGVESMATAVRAGVELAKREIDGFVASSNSDSVEGRLSRVRALIALIDTAPMTWPDQEIAAAKTDLLHIQLDLETLPSRFADTWPDWIKDPTHSAAYKSVGDRVKALLAFLETLKPIRDEWDKQVVKLIAVRSFFVGICDQGESAFSRTLSPFDCGSGIDNTPIKLTITDSTGVEKDLPIEMVTFECASPLSVSTGIAFSTRDENEFSLINQVRPGTGGGPPTLEQFKVIGSDKRSRFRPIPVLLLNTRIHDFSSDLGLHFSFGAGVDVKTGKTGSDLEFLVGPSLLLKDKFFFTVGAHIGREIRLQDGYTLGQAVPNDLATVPTFKRYTTGLGIAFTYRLK